MTCPLSPSAENPPAPGASAVSNGGAPGAVGAASNPAGPGAAAPDVHRYLYADNAATTPLSPRALEAMMPYLTSAFGNPSGIHRIAREAALALDDARARVAHELGAAHPSEIYFTSGGSESDTWVLRGAVQRFRDRYGADAPASIVTSVIEHHAILHTCEALEREGVSVTYLPVDALGHVRPSDLEDALCRAAEENRARGIDAPPAALVSIMLANNEVGTIQDVYELARVAHAHHVPFHTDAVQAVGHIPVDVAELGVDALSLSGHKFHGPRGVGALYLREGFSIPPLIRGGAQERGERAGTENVAGIVGLAAALEEACRDLRAKMERLGALRDELVGRILGATTDVRLTGDPDPARRLPGIASFICQDVDGELLVVLLDRAGVAAATGSACSTGETGPSHVITALGISDPRWTHGSLRLSLADDATEADIAELAERVSSTIARTRSLSAMV